MTSPRIESDSVGVYYAAANIALSLILSTIAIMRWNRRMLFSNTSLTSMPLVISSYAISRWVRVLLLVSGENNTPKSLDNILTNYHRGKVTNDIVTYNIDDDFKKLCDIM